MGRASLIAAVEVVDATLRRLILWIARLSGSAIRITSRGWLPVVRAVVLVALLLLVLPPVINLLLDLAGTLGVWDRLEIYPAPSVGNWWSWERVVGVAAVLLTLRWLVRARERVIVEEFVDYTSKDATAVSGLAMLLVTELSRLRELYGRVNEELSTPLSVGAGPGGPRETAAGEPGSFLSVRADEVTEVLSGAVASESKLSFAGFTIPIGVVLSLLGRVARGPRVIGSVHFTEAGGGPTVTAQIVGRGTNFTWRIDAAQCRGGAVDNAFLEPMVTEIACRMFTDMTLRGSVRWQAIQAFTEYLQLYWESLRTPKNRARFLKQAEGKLLEAVAEDETFDLAFYNLGVVYSQLAQAEYLAASTAEYPKRKSRDPDGAHAARTMAARAAFARAIQLNRGRWEAIYALAVHDFSMFKYDRWRERADDERLQKEMRSIVCRCQRVLELDRWNAQAYDLMGMAQVELKQFDKAVLSHSNAVTRTWSHLCRAEYRERRKPPTTESVLPGARANAAGALHNLARARYERVKHRGPVKRRLGVARADRIFHQALSLAPDMARAAMELERGRMREDAGRREAIDSYRAAVRVEPENPAYWAHLARAYAQFSHEKAEAIQACEAAMDELAPIYRRTLEPVCPARTLAACDETLKAVSETYRLLGQPKQRARVRALYGLADRIREAEGRDEPDVAALRAELRSCADARFEREQIGLALARSLGPAGNWPAAAEQYRLLIKELKDRRKHAIRQHALHAKHAKALRRAGKKQKALEAAAQGLLLDPISAVARRELGKAHFALLQYEEAFDAWQHTLWLTPNDATLHWKAAFSLWSVAQDRQDPAARRDALLEAAAGFERASMLFGIENATGWAWSRLWHGRVCQELDEPDLAIRHLRAAKGCDPTYLAARVLLAEVYECTGQSGLARDQYGKVEKRLPDAVAKARKDKNASGHPLDLLSDDDWGATLSYREIAARLQLGLGRHAFEVEGHEATASDHAGRAERLARELTRQPRSQNRLYAQALELQSRVALAREDLGQALEKIQRAAHLYPVPDILLRRIEIAAACARNSARVAARTQLVAGMADDLRAIYRTQGEHGDRALMGRLLVRQWIPDEVVASNGRSS